jgi:hypothetical protein
MTRHRGEPDLPQERNTRSNLKLRESTIMIKENDEPKLELFAESESNFFSKLNDVEIENISPLCAGHNCEKSHSTTILP